MRNFNTIYDIHKNLRIYSFKLFLVLLLSLNFIACQQHSANIIPQEEKEKEEKEVKELLHPIILNNDLNFEKITGDKTKLSEFLRINQTNFKKSSSQFLACGESDPEWFSSIKLLNNDLGLTLNFTSSWLEHENQKEETLNSIILEKSGSGFNNGIRIQNSNKKEVLKTFGKPKVNDDFFVNYYKKNHILIFSFNENEILNQIEIRIF